MEVSGQVHDPAALPPGMFEMNADGKDWLRITDEAEDSSKDVWMTRTHVLSSPC